MKLNVPMKTRVECRSGFTLTEIMIVVTLVGMLASIALPNFIRSRATAHTNACISNLREIDEAIQQWAMEERKAAATTIQFTDISSFLRNSVLCPAGGTSFADSYSISVVGAEPVCQRVPASHLLSQAGSDVAAGPPPGQGAPGKGHGRGNGNGGNGHGG